MIGQFIELMLVGCIVAMATRGREMVSTLTLALIRGPLTGVVLLVATLRHWPHTHTVFLLPFPISTFTGSIVIVIGGVIVRILRSTSSHGALSA